MEVNGHISLNEIATQMDITRVEAEKALQRAIDANDKLLDALTVIYRSGSVPFYLSKLGKIIGSYLLEEDQKAEAKKEQP